MSTIKPSPDGVPMIPPRDPIPAQSEYIAVCGECGVKIPRGPWGYACQRPRCPIFPQVAS